MHPRRQRKRQMKMARRRRRMMEMMSGGGMPEMGSMASPMAGQHDRHGQLRGRRHRHHRGTGTRFHDRLKKNQAIGLLEDILAGLKAGTVEIQNGDDQVTLKPAGKMDVRLRTHQTENSEVLGLRLQWRRRNDGSKAANLKITSGETDPNEPE